MQDWNMDSTKTSSSSTAYRVVRLDGLNVWFSISTLYLDAIVGTAIINWL